MKLYLYDPDANECAGIGISSRQEEVAAIHSCDDRLSPTWVVLSYHDFEDNPLRRGDFPSLSNYRRIPVMTVRAWTALRALIGYCCEPLPIVGSSGIEYFIVHVMETIDCLDEGRSELRRSRIDGRVNRVLKYAFRRDLLARKHIFKLPRQSGGELIVDQEFRSTVENHALTGLRFRELPIVEGA